MLNGLWGARFSSDQGVWGTGVAVFQGDQVAGGDASFYYLGTLRNQNGSLSGEIEVIHYANEPVAIFGNIKNFKLIVTGSGNDRAITLRGHVDGNPNLKITIECTKLADLRQSSTGATR